MNTKPDAVRQALAEREAFEAWCVKRWCGDRGGDNFLRFETDGPYADQYRKGNVEFAWCAWRAALDSQAAELAEAVEANNMTDIELGRLRAELAEANEWVKKWRSLAETANMLQEMNARSDERAKRLGLDEAGTDRFHCSVCGHLWNAIDESERPADECPVCGASALAAKGEAK